MNLEYRWCTPNEILKLIECFDSEFSKSKNSFVSVKDRYPNVFFGPDLQKIRVVVLDDKIVGAHSIRDFQWADEQINWQGAMIGLVWVAPEHRGMGIGAFLVEKATQYILDQQYDFGVLWTKSPLFFERFGWTIHDTGLISEVTNPNQNPVNIKVSKRILEDIDIPLLETIRAKYMPCRVLRASIDYQTLPMPVSCVHLLSDPQHEAFALVGEQNGIGFVYEVVGPSNITVDLWNDIAKRYTKIVVNGQSDDRFSQYLSHKGYVNWRQQQMAMWIKCSNHIDEGVLARWHIPYYDWI
jgi:GNAT superfamily N-acetyltransferase